MLELHCHTTYSDGTLTPTALVKAARQAGIQALAITDHDTLAGWSEAFQAAQTENLDTENLDIVPGVELSTVCNGRSLHILGFYPNPAQLNPPLQERVAGRHRRAQQIVDKLAKLGYAIEYPNLGEGIAPSRPHIARALVAAGYANSCREAFDRWLKDDGVAYVPYEKFTAVEGVRLLRDCGGVPVWAHPFLFRGGKIEEILPELIEAGLLGIEVYHPAHTPTQIAQLEKICQDKKLLKTGGSDYHGPQEEGGPEETRLNQLNLSLSLLAPLTEAAKICRIRE
ncbi:PHP domain-containing protein [Spirulina sp. CS-785/01]|uniref:PHP domain-containing protein n=1 Tax=Spirulina sp. CS-785/01 TaxID=3021716 RepID=UPI00232CB6F4|nr:PHP domain-containing protein [Spirulina sp. CS-785/01]MDB9313013.1 PHP domain-containing protein [Spirulina sp. CS-785/01]